MKKIIRILCIILLITSKILSQNVEERKELKKIVRKNKGKLTIMNVGREKMEDMIKKIGEVQEYIKEVEGMEKVEKQYFMASIELAKAENMIAHKDEIMSRPKREWKREKKELGGDMISHAEGKRGKPDRKETMKRGKKNIRKIGRDKTGKRKGA